MGADTDLMVKNHSQANSWKGTFLFQQQAPALGYLTELNALGKGSVSRSLAVGQQAAGFWKSKLCL